MVLVFDLTHCIPQNTLWTIFSTLVTAILHFDLFDFNLEKEKCSKVCITSGIYFSRLRKKIVSSAKTVCIRTAK